MFGGRGTTVKYDRDVLELGICIFLWWWHSMMSFKRGFKFLELEEKKTEKVQFSTKTKRSDVMNSSPRPSPSRPDTPVPAL